MEHCLAEVVRDAFNEPNGSVRHERHQFDDGHRGHDALEVFGLKQALGRHEDRREDDHVVEPP